MKAKPYKEEVGIEKLEYIGHFEKRFGYFMRKIKVEMKGKKLSDGKGFFLVNVNRKSDKINIMVLHWCNTQQSHTTEWNV